MVIFSAATLLAAGDKLNTSYISTSPGSSTVIQVAKEAGFSDKHGLDATVIFISGSVRGIQAILAGEIPVGEGGGPGLASARLAGGDVVAIAGNVNVLPYYLVAQSSIKRAGRSARKDRRHSHSWDDCGIRTQSGSQKNRPRTQQRRHPAGHRRQHRAHGGVAKGYCAIHRRDRSGKAQAEKLGYPMVVDMASLQIPFPQNGVYTSTKADPGKSGYGPALYACLHRSDPLLQNP